MDTWNELKSNEDTLKPIVKKWNSWDSDVTILCCSIIGLSCEQIEKNFDMTNDLSDFDDKRVALQRRIVNYFSKYLNKFFELFLHALKATDKLKGKEEWAKELDELMCFRLNKLINENGHAWFAKKIEEIVIIQIFFGSFRKEFDEIDKLGEDVLKKQQEILNFNWPDDSLFNKWMIDLV